MDQRGISYPTTRGRCLLLPALLSIPTLNNQEEAGFTDLSSIAVDTTTMHAFTAYCLAHRGVGLCARHNTNAALTASATSLTYAEIAALCLLLWSKRPDDTCKHLFETLQLYPWTVGSGMLVFTKARQHLCSACCTASVPAAFLCAMHAGADTHQQHCVISIADDKQSC